MLTYWLKASEAADTEVYNTFQQFLRSSGRLGLWKTCTFWSSQKPAEVPVPKLPTLNAWLIAFATKQK